MPTTALRLIPEPPENSRTVFRGPPSEPIFRGQGDITYTCGKCGRPLAENMVGGQIDNVVFFCEPCGVYNDVP